MALTASAAQSSATTEAPTPIETMHEDMIHDAQLDYYGKRLATCSSDRTVKVFDVVDGRKSGQGETLYGHEGPVWQVAWAHPKFGPILASASYDGKVIIWKDNGSAGGRAQQQQAYGGYGAQQNAGGWTKIKEHSMHSASVNSIAWAPHEFGSILACASSDGNISVLTFNDDGTWAVDMVSAHPIGCNAVSWAPATASGALLSGQTAGGADGGPAPKVKLFASAGCDNVIKIWEFSMEQNRWDVIDQLEGHSDWIRDVTFSPNIGLPRSYLASASQDRTVIIWTKDGDSPWTQTVLTPTGSLAPGAALDESTLFKDTVWRVNFSLSGNVLAVSCGDGMIYLFKEGVKGGWECVSELNA
jgi:protein transport protein SEC13